jgi:hypothetical protein
MTKNEAMSELIYIVDRSHSYSGQEALAVIRAALAELGTTQNGAMDAFLALYGTWRTTVGKHYEATVLDHFINWVQEQQAGV